jgi:hypothetical protein
VGRADISLIRRRQHANAAAPGLDPEQKADATEETPVE